MEVYFTQVIKLEGPELPKHLKAAKQLFELGLTQCQNKLEPCSLTEANGTIRLHWC
jgi:hypothetical protein